jgi:hypothetical protein
MMAEEEFPELLEERDKSPVDPNDYMRLHMEVMKKVVGNIDRQNQAPLIPMVVAPLQYRPPRILSISAGTISFNLFNLHFDLSYSLRRITERHQLPESKNEQ